MNKVYSAFVVSLLLSSMARADLSNFGLFDANGNPIILGQSTMTGGLPVSIASNQSALPITQSGTWTTGRTWTLLNTTDSVNSVQSGAWSVTANAGTNLNTSALALSATQTNGTQKTQVVDASGNIAPAGDTAARSSYTRLTDGTNTATLDNPGSSGAVRINVDSPDITTASTALGALNASVSVPVTGMGSAGFQINAGTLIGTLQPQCSIDGGTTWASANFYNPSTNLNSTSFAFTTSNPTTVLGLVAIAGSSHCRVTVSAYTSGTANAIMRASQITGASGSIPSTVSLNNFFYDDMNVANGGIARATSFVVSAATTLYSRSGSGTVYGFTLNLSGLGGAQVYAIDLLLDGIHIFGASGISTLDLLNSAIYDISQVSTDNLGFAGWAFPDKAIRWTVPGGGQVSYSTSVVVKVTQTAGGAGKFNAGLIALTR